MEIGSLSCMYFTLVEQVGPDQPGVHHSLGLGWPTQLALGQLVCIILAAAIPLHMPFFQPVFLFYVAP